MFKTVKSEVALIYVGLVAIIVLLGAISLLDMIRVSRIIDGLIVTNYNSITRLNAMKETLREQDKAVFAHIYGDTSDGSERLSKLGEMFLANFDNEHKDDKGRPFGCRIAS